ncbi:MAG: protein kinase [Chloroflexi bacterium]|nr:protein kinase [Chloroflexota bacterium]
MPIHVHCPHPECQATFERPESDAGRLVACPSCHRPTTVPASSDGTLAGLTLGEYKLVRRVAKGGMGQIYEAVQLKLDRKVALKVLSDELAGNPAFLQRFEREAKAAAAINHPHLVQVYDFGHADSRAFLVMEYIEGEDLSKWVARQGKLQLMDALQIIEDVALALQEALTRNIIHRDVKPGNILLTSKGQVKLSDLGLARRLDEEVELTATGVGIGSPHFMSPEQADDARRVDHRADIYSLGITLLFLLTGTRPFDGPSSYAVVLAHANKPLPRGEDLGVKLPDNVEALIRRMAAKDPQGRYQTYAELLEDIQRVRLGQELAERPGSVGDETMAMEVVPAPTCSLVRPTVTRQRTVPVLLHPQPTEPPHRSRWPLYLAGSAATGGVLLTILVLAPRLADNRAASRAAPDSDTALASKPPWAGGDWPPRVPGQPGLGAGFRPPPPPSPLKPLVEIEHPLADGTLEQLWSQAQAYAQSHPTNYGDILARLNQVRTNAGGSTLEKEVGRAVATWTTRKEGAVKKEIKTFTERMEQNGRLGHGPHSLAVWRDFPDQLRSAEVDEQIHQIIYEFVLRFPPGPARGLGPAGPPPGGPFPPAQPMPRR